MQAYGFMDGSLWHAELVSEEVIQHDLRNGKLSPIFSGQKVGLSDLMVLLLAPTSLAHFMIATWS